jgi:hypothetical protein
MFAGPQAMPTAFPDTRRELVALAPDVIVAPTSTTTDAPLL